MGLKSRRELRSVVIVIKKHEVHGRGTHSDWFETANKHTISHSFFYQRRSHGSSFQLLQAVLPLVHLFHQSIQLSLRVSLSFNVNISINIQAVAYLEICKVGPGGTLRHFRCTMYIFKNVQILAIKIFEH